MSDSKDSNVDIEIQPQAAAVPVPDAQKPTYVRVEHICNGIFPSVVSDNEILGLKTGRCWGGCDWRRCWFVSWRTNSWYVYPDSLFACFDFILQ